MSKQKDTKYEKLANQIYNLISEADPNFGDAVASLELVRLWIIADYMDLHFSDEDEDDNNVDIIEVSTSNKKKKETKTTKPNNDIVTEVSEIPKQDNV